MILNDQVWVRQYCEKWTKKDALRISPSNKANYWQCKIRNISTRKNGIYNKILESKCNFTINDINYFKSRKNESLPCMLRVRYLNLLLTHGVVTKILCAYICRPMQVSKISETNV